MSMAKIAGAGCRARGLLLPVALAAVALAAAAPAKAPLHKYSRASLPTMADERCQGRGRWYDKQGVCECFYPYVGDVCGDKDTQLPEREYNGVIRYLTSPLENDVGDLLRSIETVEQMFNSKFHYPYLVFHDGLSAEQKERILAVAQNPVWFARSVFFDEISEGVSESKFWKFCKKREQVDGFCKPPTGYLKMCRWSSGRLYQEPAMLPFDLEMHLDTDSLLTHPVERDIFAVMHEGGYSFGYTHFRRDLGHVVKGFWDTTLHFIDENNIDIEEIPLMKRFISPNREYDSLIYMADFEVTRPDFFGDPDSPAFKYYEALDKAGGFFTKRWGNNLARTLAVWLFLDESEVYQFPDIGYRHQGVSICPIYDLKISFAEASRKGLMKRCTDPNAMSDDTIKRNQDLRRMVARGKPLNELPAFDEPLERALRMKKEANERRRGIAIMKEAIAADQTLDEYLQSNKIKIAPGAVKAANQYADSGGHVSETEIPTGKKPGKLRDKFGIKHPGHGHKHVH